MERYTELTKERLLNVKARINEASVPRVLTFLNADGTAHDITAYDFEVIVKKIPNAPSNLFTLTIGDGLTVIGADNNKLQIDVTAARATQTPNVYFWRLFASGEDHTWLNGDWEFLVGKYDGITETDTITISETAGDITIEITSGDGSGSGLVSFTTGNLSPLFTATLGADPLLNPALTFTAVNQNANLVYAGPSTGAAAAPTFRAIVAADLGTGANGTKFLRDDMTWQTVTSSGHVIENSGTPLTPRANLNFTNGLTASDNTPDTDVKLGGTITASTSIATGSQSLFIGATNSGLHINTPYITTGGGYTLGLWASSPLLGDGVAVGFGDIDGTGDGSYAGIFTGAADREVSMGAAATNGDAVELFFQAAAGVGAFTCVFDDSRVISGQVGIQYGADYSAGFQARSLIDKGYADATYAPISVVGTVTSVSGTTNRITSTGGATPVIDIDAAYVGQTSITTLGTIGTGAWGASVIGPAFGGTGVANNAASTITISGNFATTLTVTGATGVTLPTTGTLATLTGAEALTNKTLVAASNTITDTSAVTGDLFKHNGTRFVRFPMGSALQVLRVNAGATDLEYAAAGSFWDLASGGTLTGANTITGSGTNTLKFVFDGLAVTPINGAGAWFANTTAAAAGAQQISPSIVLEGQGRKTTATAESQSVKWKFDVLPVQGAANPLSHLRIMSSVNGAAYTQPVTLVNDTGVGIPGISFAASTLLYWEGNTAKSLNISSNNMNLSTFAAYIFTNWTGAAYVERYRISNPDVGSTSGTPLYTQLTANFSPTSGTATMSGHVVIGTINQTGGANGQITFHSVTPTITAAVNVTGYDYNPITPANVSGTHLAYRATSGISVFGSTTGANAHVVIGAGTTALAALKMTSGTDLTTAVAGCFEYNGTDLRFTKTGTTRGTVLVSTAVTTEVVVSDTTLTITHAGTTYKILARA